MRKDGGFATFTIKVLAILLGHARSHATSADFIPDALPPDLRIKLRANREDLTLPDNHGQIWAGLATLGERDPTLFQGGRKDVEMQILRQLGLGSKIKFPVRRLTTLWRNTRWRDMITRWCSIPIGRETFNISTFEWMSSCRIDDVRAHYC